MAAPVALQEEFVSLANRILIHRKQDPSAGTEQFTLQYLNLLARLRADHRQACLTQLAAKGSATHARTEMDRVALELQNLMYEQQHLQREIKKCLEYDSQYDKVPLHGEDDFRQQAAQNGVQVSEEPHQLMLQRLQFELDERQRLEIDRKDLLAKKLTVTNSNAEKKQALDDLDRQLEDFVAASKEIQQKMITLNP